MSKYKVEGFPTILVFGADKESPLPYQGARVASAIESFALEQLEANSAPPEVHELTSSVRLYSINNFCRSHNE
jgi:protein disulfide-isomerase A6